MSSDTQPLRTIRLLGELGRRFGREHRLAVKTPAEAVRALCVIRPGFRAHVDSRERFFQVRVKGDPVTDHERELHMAHGHDSEFIIAPVLAGSKSKWLGVLLGAVLIVSSFFLPTAPLIAGVGSSSLASMAFGIGAAMVLGGIAQMLAPTPKFETAENKPSYLFNGPVQSAQQGYPVPVGYGELVVGGGPISQGIWPEDLPV